MNTFVILAAGRGSRMGRVGDVLHKALVPLAGRAVISHIIDHVQPDENLVIVTGYQSAQVQAYVQLAHPDRRVVFVHAPGWNTQGGGPGRSLLRAWDDDVIEGDLTFTSCDTLWTDYPSSIPNVSWMAVAPMPAGTHPARWCRVQLNSGDSRVKRVLDKTHALPSETLTWVGLGHVIESDIYTFFNGIINSKTIAGETQMTSGFAHLVKDADRPVAPRYVEWMDVGDEDAYRRAVAITSGYDFTKPGQATYVLPKSERVIKFHCDPTTIGHRLDRGMSLGTAVPSTIQRSNNFIAYEYVPGVTAYEAQRQHGLDVAVNVVDWYNEHFVDHGGRGINTLAEASSISFHTMRFYRDKTYARISHLDMRLKSIVTDAVSNVNWQALADGARIGQWHGDLNYANIIMSSGRIDQRHPPRIVAIDWREDFNGITMWGDQRYDVAKLVAGCYVDWQAAQRGDLRPAHLDDHANYFRQHLVWDHNTEVIAALTYINSAPLHAAPFDEVLAMRGVQWLERIL